MRKRYLIIINWHGETHNVYRHANSSNQALQYAIREVARRVKYSVSYVHNYVIDNKIKRWEIKQYDNKA